MTWLNLMFLVLAVLSIVISIVIFIASKKEKRPYFHVRTFRLIQDSLNTIEAVEILYKGQRVQNLSLAKVALWNKGRDTINSQDVAPKDPLRISVQSPVKLLGAKIIHTANPVNNFLILPDLERGEIQIQFDYFHRLEGIVVQLYHTGSGENDLALLGTIKGVKRIIRASPKEDYFADLFIDPLERWLNTINPPVVRGLLTFSITLILFPILGLLLFIYILMRPMRKIPRQFSLDD